MQLVNGFNHQSRSPRCDACGGPPGKTVPADPTSIDRPVLDLGIFIEQEGSVNICLTCAEEAGSLAGCISAAKSAELITTVDDLEEDLIEAEATLKTLEDALAALMRVPSVAKKAAAKKAPAVKKAAA